MCVFGGRFRAQLQPCRWKRIKLFGRYLCCSFTCVIQESVPQPELHRGRNMDADCWLPWRNVDAAAAKRRNCRLLLQKTKKKQFSKSSDKTSSTTGSSAAMFLVDMICTQTPAHWHSKIPINSQKQKFVLWIQQCDNASAPCVEGNFLINLPRIICIS